jgi:hypothetical protein
LSSGSRGLLYDKRIATLETDDCSKIRPVMMRREVSLILFVLSPTWAPLITAAESHSAAKFRLLTSSSNHF